ncbi:MAG: metal-dependent transcriptional regulator [Thaumarchaeota archaeon S15]|nr:MAG: metal-dependent transcriptional regulator [Thaumarchaeota archaeon S15]
MEMYLKAIWHLRERGEEVKISTIARMLHIRQPSVVQMLKKLDRQGFVEYDKLDVKPTAKGFEIAAKMIRNSRLLEVLMDEALKIDIDEELVCGTEHHMSKQFTDALCTMLGHPRRCPHGLDIPKGECCKEGKEAE